MRKHKPLNRSFHKQGKSIMFKKSEIDAWLEVSTYRKSQKDLEREAAAFINGKRRSSGTLLTHQIMLKISQTIK